MAQREISGQRAGKEDSETLRTQCGGSECTTEPLSYYTHTRNTPQNILILENKDPFFSMRNYLLNGHTEIFGAEIGTLIYGAGKGIIRSFQDFDLCAEPYMKHPKNTIYYFGDM